MIGIDRDCKGTYLALCLVNRSEEGNPASG